MGEHHSKPIISPLLRCCLSLGSLRLCALGLFPGHQSFQLCDHSSRDLSFCASAAATTITGTGDAQFVVLGRRECRRERKEGSARALFELKNMFSEFFHGSFRIDQKLHGEIILSRTVMAAYKISSMISRCTMSGHVSAHPSDPAPEAGPAMIHPYHLRTISTTQDPQTRLGLEGTSYFATAPPRRSSPNGSFVINRLDARRTAQALLLLRALCSVSPPPSADALREAEQIHHAAPGRCVFFEVLLLLHSCFASVLPRCR